MLIDTNIFLEVFLDQEKAEQCLHLLNQIENGERHAFVTDFTLHSIAVNLESIGRKNNLPEIFASLANFVGLTLLHVSIREHAEIAILAQNLGLDFDDAYQAYLAKQKGIPIVSFDSHFDNILERWTPEDLLRKA